MTSDLSLFYVVLHASLVVQLVLLVLLLASIISWTMIFDRARIFAAARKSASAFEEQFWSGGDLGALYQNLSQNKRQQRGLPAIFCAGFKEYVRMRKIEDNDVATILHGSERAMRVALSRELDRLESNLTFLATVGSTSPYVGLFGTVWGIMQSFHALGNVEQATLALVAPGISEALIATAIGLFAAIPAVIAYNRYANQVERLANRYEEFMDEFVALLQRQGRG
ncbi:protein TolQ [Chromatium okenii]|jgi:biopolymer transport protein TolQ|uniref:Tol-Pal system protein TolQ n=1 Tax=Chromatium okenii TaxID=61644 RepID=A0A2S7XVE6_9GAMM|nr:protein TolQ [Chromatium okenii]PQJ97513.1 protein TolQ [Chromatium okenii]